MMSERVRTAHEHAWRSFLEAHRLVTSRLEEELQTQTGTPLVWFDVLLRLSESDDNRCRMQELAQAVLISKSGLTRLIDRMERAGLVEREACEEDRRGTYARLTDDGHATLEECLPVYSEGVQQHFADLMDDEQATLINELMTRIADKARPDS